MKFGCLVVDAAVEVGPLLCDTRPFARADATQYGFRDNIGSVTRADEASGKAGQIVSIFSVDLAVSRLHTHTMPRNPHLGDTQNEILYRCALIQMRCILLTGSSCSIQHRGTRDPG